MISRIKKEAKGFTLIELLVVIAIIAILATLVLLGLDSARETARDADRKGVINQARAQAQIHLATNDDYNGFCSNGGNIDDVHNETIRCDDGTDYYTVWVNLREGDWFCTDETLEVGEVSDNPANELEGTERCPF